MKYLCLISVSIFVFLFSSCSAGKVINDTTLYAEVLTHRQKTEQGLTISERAPLDMEGLKGLRYFEIKEKFNVIAQVRSSEEEKPFELPTYSGITKTYIKYATLTFELGGKKYDLNVYKNLEVIRMPQYKNYLFLPFKDRTNGDSTYGGGRYINLSTLDINEGSVALDFNKSYNPWCAYSDGFNCPIPPVENHLEVAILAGEKNYKGK